MATSRETGSPTARGRAIQAAENRIKVLTILADLIAQDPAHQEKVQLAREHVLALQEEIKKLRVRRGPEPKTAPPRRENLAAAGSSRKVGLSAFAP